VDQWLVLDEREGPEDVLQLVAYRDSEAAWIGVAGRDHGLLGAVGLGTGSDEHQVEATSIVDRGFGVAFGGIAPGVERTEVVNDSGEVFDAAVHPLPDALGTDYRAVWGFAERCRRRCEIRGYDRRGRVYEWTDPRVDGPEPSDEERMAAIRAHAHRSMRYYATASLAETGDSKRSIEAFMGITAHYLALLEAPALDDRSALVRGDRIVRRYVEEAKTDPWEPGACSFCGDGPVAAWFEGPSFRTFVRRWADVRAEEAWLACSGCLSLVEADDRDGLARRGARRLRHTPDDRRIRMAREIQDREFWRPRELD
jgi:hypothetical protein